MGRSLFSDKIASASKREKGLTEKVWVEGSRAGREEKGRLKVIRKEKKEKERQEKGKEWGKEEEEEPRLRGKAKNVTNWRRKRKAFQV